MSIKLFVAFCVLLNAGQLLAAGETTEEVNRIEKSNEPVILRNDLSEEQRNKMFTIVHLNDSHENLSVKWLGKGSSVMIVLAKNNKPKPNTNVTTNVYVSYDYGSTFKKEDKLQLPNGSQPILNTFITSKLNNSHFLFTDVVNNFLFVSTDYGQTYERIKLQFSPKIVQIHSTIPGYILASDDTEPTDLFLSYNFGRRWELIHHNVTKWSWASNYEQSDRLRQDRIYALVLTPNGQKGFYQTDKYFEDKPLSLLRNNVKDFKICNKYVVVIRWASTLGGATKEVGLKMDVAFNKTQLNMALFNKTYSNTDIADFHVVDCSDNELLVAARSHNVKDRANLFVSNMKGNRFKLVLRDVVLSTANNKTTVDVHKVAGLSGIYIANAYENKTNTVISLTTYDSGYSWNKINLTQVQSDEIRKNCTHENCSLHFIQSSMQYAYKFPGITTKESAVGIVLASGIIDESLKNDTKITSRQIPQTFLSRDAGKTWKWIADGKYLFNIGDNGGVIVGVKHYSKSTATTNLIYSLDDGHTFKELQFINESLRVYSLLTENGEKTSVFTVFGALDNGNQGHSWTLAKVNLTSLFNDSICRNDDFEYWAPHSTENTQCFLGVKYNFLRRKENKTCLHGEEFNRKSKPTLCPCTREDYICDFGFYENENRNCIPNLDNQLDEPDCKDGGSKTMSRGFQRIPGNQCLATLSSPFEPIQFLCPAKQQRSVFKTMFISLLLTTIVFCAGYFGIAYFRTRHTRSSLLTTYNRRTDSAILLDADDLGDEVQVRGFSDDVPMVIS